MELLTVFGYVCGCLLGLVALTYLVELLYRLMDALVSAVGYGLLGLGWVVMHLRLVFEAGVRWCWRKAVSRWRR